MPEMFSSPTLSLSLRFAGLKTKKNAKRTNRQIAINSNPPNDPDRLNRFAILFFRRLPPSVSLFLAYFSSEGGGGIQSPKISKQTPNAAADTNAKDGFSLTIFRFAEFIQPTWGSLRSANVNSLVLVQANKKNHTLHALVQQSHKGFCFCFVFTVCWFSILTSQTTPLQRALQNDNTLSLSGTLFLRSSSIFAGTGTSQPSENCRYSF